MFTTEPTTQSTTEPTTQSGPQCRAALPSQRMRVRIRVEGREACFTCPETPVDRYSYPVMTPSAARGILSNIFWKPEFEWRVMSITVLNPEHRFERMTNETSEKGGKFCNPIDTTAHRSQRFTVGLSDVAYIIEATPLPLTRSNGMPTYHPMKFVDIFNRRVRKGARYAPICLGMSHMRAQVYMAEEEQERVDSSDTENSAWSGREIDLGRMFLDWGIEGVGVGNHGAVPIYFNPVLKNGVYVVPQAEVFGWTGRPYKERQERQERHQYQQHQERDECQESTRKAYINVI